MGRQGELMIRVMAAEMRSPNVSVTPINIEPYPPLSLTNDDSNRHATNNQNGPSVQQHQSSPTQHHQHQHHQHHHHHHTTTTGSTTTTTIVSNGGIIEPFDSSDAEVAQIDFQSAVNLRNKKKRGGGGGGAANGPPHEMPRPMSWEGELSDGEKEMCVDEDNSSQVILNRPLCK